MDEHGFRLVSATEEVVQFQSSELTITASYYPQEMQVDVKAARLNRENSYEELGLSGMVGRASPTRLLELAAEKLRVNKEALAGDESYYHRLGEEARRESEAWTAYYSGKGPQPRGKLP